MIERTYPNAASDYAQCHSPVVLEGTRDQRECGHVQQPASETDAEPLAQQHLVKALRPAEGKKAQQEEEGPGRQYGSVQSTIVERAGKHPDHNQESGLDGPDPCDGRGRFRGVI